MPWLIDIQKLDAKIDAVDGRVDKCLVAINRLDERMNAQFAAQAEATKSLRSVLAAGIAGIILQYFF